LQIIKGEAAQLLIRRGALAISFHTFEELHKSSDYVVTFYYGRNDLYALSIEYKNSDSVIIFGTRQEIELFIKDLLAQFIPDYIRLVLDKYYALTVS
jgi:hypothetical protein